MGDRPQRPVTTLVTTTNGRTLGIAVLVVGVILLLCLAATLTLGAFIAGAMFNLI